VTRKERLSGDRSSLTSESEMFLEDMPMRQRSVKSPFLDLVFSSSFELDESLLELREAHVLVVVVIVVLIGGVELLPLGAVGDEVGGVTTLEAALSSSPSGTCVRLETFSPVRRSSHRGCFRTAHQKLWPKRTRQTIKQMR
jgi:hypothetical protein